MKNDQISAFSSIEHQSYGWFLDSVYIVIKMAKKNCDYIKVGTVSI